MKTMMRTATFAFGLAGVLASAPMAGARTSLNGVWQKNSSTVVKEGGEVVSSARFRPQGWYPAKLPGTVLGAQTKVGVYPDLRCGLNSFEIPDASDEYNKAQNLSQYSHLPDKRNPWTDPWWFRRTFSLPRFAPGTHVWLHFDSINYSAEVWLNGHLAAGRDRLVGANRRRERTGYRSEISSNRRMSHRTEVVSLQSDPIGIGPWPRC